MNFRKRLTEKLYIPGSGSDVKKPVDLFNEAKTAPHPKLTPEPVEPSVCMLNLGHEEMLVVVADKNPHLLAADILKRRGLDTAFLLDRQSDFGEPLIGNEVPYIGIATGRGDAVFSYKAYVPLAFYEPSQERIFFDPHTQFADYDPARVEAAHENLLQVTQGNRGQGCVGIFISNPDRLEALNHMSFKDFWKDDNTPNFYKPVSTAVEMAEAESLKNGPEIRSFR